MSITDHIDRFLLYLERERGLSPETIRAYRSDLGLFCEWMMEATGEDTPDCDAISSGTIRGFVVSLHTAGYARSTIGRRIAAVNAFAKYLVSEAVLKENPASDISAPKTPYRLPTVLSKSEVDAMMSLPDTSTALGLRDRTILELLYSTGLRRSELVGVRTRDLADGEESVRVLGKGQKDRIVPVGSVARKLLQRWLKVRDALVDQLPEQNRHEHVFLRNNGAPIDGNALYAIVRHYMAQVTEQTKRSPHVLRHSFATHMLDAGAGLREVGELLGHASLGTTQVYTHVTIDRLKAAYRQAHPRSGAADSGAQESGTEKDD